MKKGICILFICLFGGVLTYAQSPQDVIKKSVLEQQWNLIDDFKTFLDKFTL